MPADEPGFRELEDELTELRIALQRKRSEVSNLKVGYVRAVEGVGPIPAEPLKRNLIAARAELVEIERRLTSIEAQLEGAERASSRS